MYIYIYIYIYMYIYIYIYISRYCYSILYADRYIEGHVIKLLAKEAAIWTIVKSIQLLNFNDTVIAKIGVNYLKLYLEPFYAC